MDHVEIRLARIEQKFDDFIQSSEHRHRDLVERMVRSDVRTDALLADHEVRIRSNEAMKGKVTALAGTVSLILSMGVAFFKSLLPHHN